jgi:glycosyltransferase involved in cell wall biosynthesis
VPDQHRILFVEASVGGVLGGSLTGILQLIERMDRRRFAPALVLYESKDVVPALRASGVPVHILPPLPDPLADGTRGRLGRAWLRAYELASVVAPRARALARLFRQEQPDLVYLANAVTTNLDGLVAAALCGLPIMVHEKGLRRIGPAERFMSRWLDTLVGMTEQVTAHARNRGIRARRFLTVYDGIDCEQFAPGGGGAIRREFGIPADAPLVGIVGHLQRWKGQLLVVEAVARARARSPELHCLIVGGVHRLGEEYAAEVRALIAAHGLERHVTLTGARRDVPACMDAMDVVIHSSTRPEPFGRVLIEAMALGRPVIAPRLGGPCEIVADGETGLLVSAGDAGALAGAIVELITDPARRSAMGRAARERVDRVFDIRQHVRTMENIFDEILSAGATKGRVSRSAPGNSRDERVTPTDA